MRTYPSYAKKDISIGFVLWVGGGAARISGLTEKGAEIVQPELVRLPYGEYVFEHEALPSPYLGGEYSVDGFVFATAGVKWTFAKNVASLKLKCAKTGVVTGSFKMFYSTGAAKPKSDTAKFTGMLIGEKVFGTAVVKKKSVYLSAGASPRK